jgi:hypothetical protein
MRKIQDHPSADAAGRAFYRCDPAVLPSAGIRHQVPQRTTAMLDAPTAEATGSSLSEQKAAARMKANGPNGLTRTGRRTPCRPMLEVQRSLTFFALVRRIVGLIIAAMTFNATAKIVMAIGLGTRGFALRIVPGIALSMLAAWMTAALMGLRG